MDEYGNNNVIRGVTTTGGVSYGTNPEGNINSGINNNSTTVGYGGVSSGINGTNSNNVTNGNYTNYTNGGATASSTVNLPTELGLWSKVKAFFLQDICVELTPRQKKIEKEINEFLFQEISFFGKKKNKK